MRNATLLAQAAARLSGAATITVLTGAGVSAASGVPTFRGQGGLWKNRDATSLATPEAFAADPAFVWEWYMWRRRQVAACSPNPAHEVLARWARQRPGCRVVTQNVDDLHVRAGTPGLIRLHGSLWELSCFNRCGGMPGAWPDTDVADAALRQCPHCGGPARPGVVWFGEALDPDILAAALDATRCDVFITAGTSAVVYPAAQFVHEARRAGACTIEINPDTTPATGVVDLAIAAPAEQALVAIAALSP